MKIGQFPSLADFRLAGVDSYNQVLSKEERKEFVRAIGLHACGIGIGSFVYLRRLFEKLIDRAHDAAKAGDGWSEEDYKKSRMHERIKLLRSLLPQALVANAGIYSILSRGVHALSEDECLRYFGTLKLGIEQILDEELEKRKKLERERRLKAEIAKIEGGGG